MSSLSTERARQARELCDQAWALPSGERAAFLDAACGATTPLRRQVDAWLAVRAAAEAEEADTTAVRRWKQVEALFEEAIDRSAEDRAAFLDAFCGDDAALRQELESLLAYDEAAAGYFEDLADAVLPTMQPGMWQMDASSSGLDTLIGQRVTHYEVIERLGQGGMGVVFKARDVHLGRPVALKFLAPHLEASASAQARFMQEARAASALDHAHIGTVYEVVPGAGTPSFIVMAYYEGTTLKERIEGGPVPLAEALDYAAQMAEGLDCAHAAGIVHRDVKPANVICTPGGEVKIVDFGLAKVHDVHLTQSGTMLGTVAYMSPEQASGRPVDHRTDIWALGAVLYELCTGTRAFGGTQSPAVLRAVLHDEPVPATQLRPDLPPALDTVLARCLAKDPAARYQDMETLLADLRRLEQGVSVASLPAVSLPAASSADAVQTAPRAASEEPAWQRQAGWAGVAVVSILLIGGLLWLMAHRAPMQRHLAVLPFQMIGDAREASTLSAGLLETLTSKLTQLEQFQQAVWVVPASEVDDTMTPTDARQQLGVSLVVTGSIQFEADLIRLTLNLVDATTRRQLGSAQLDHRAASLLALQDEAVLVLARMLKVNLDEEARATLTAGGTASTQANALYLRGQGALRQYQTLADLEEAIGLFRAAVAEDAGFALAYAGLGEAYWQKYRLTDDPQWADAAERESQRALALSDGLAPVYVTLGVIRRGRGQDAEALDALNRALALDPFYAEAYRRRGRVYQQRGQFEQAEADYRQAIALKPDYWRGYSSLGGFYYTALGDYEAAAAQYQRGLELAPANVSLLASLGATTWQLGQLDEAVAHFERVLEVDPANALARSNLATAYFYRGRFREAVAYYQEEVALRPHDYELWGYLADAYFWTPGRRAEARGTYRRALDEARSHLAVSAQSPDLLSSIATYHARLGQADSAWVYVRQLEATLQPEQTGVVTAFGLGELYEHLGARDQALGWMTYALERGYGWVQVDHSPWLAALRQDAGVQRRFASIR